MKKILVIVGLVVLLGLMLMSSYNGLVSSEEGVKSAWAQVENVYQRRLDLIPNLVQTVKGSAAHEQETLQGVVEARSKASQITASPELVNSPEAMQKFQAAQGELSGALSRLMVVVERYPDLKANQSFLNLQSQLEGTENRIAVERKRFNEVAQEFNTKRRRFPTSLLANAFGFEEKAYFQAEAGANQVPKVDFGTPQ
jgi:LemA protein